MYHYRLLLEEASLRYDDVEAERSLRLPPEYELAAELPLKLLPPSLPPSELPLSLYQLLSISIHKEAI